MKLTIRQMLAFTSLILVPLLCIEDHDAFAVRGKVVKVKKKKKKVRIVKKRRVVKQKGKIVKKNQCCKKTQVVKEEQKVKKNDEEKKVAEKKNVEHEEEKIVLPKLEIKEDPTMLTVHRSVKKLKDGQYAGSKYNEVFIPDNVTYIGNMCFANCQNLDAIRLPQNMVDCGKNILTNTANVRIDVPRHARILQDGKNYHMIIGTNIFSLGDIDKPRFLTYDGEDKNVVDLSKEVKMYLPLGLHKIPAGAFSTSTQNTGHVNLVDRTGTVENVEFAAFENCGWLDTIELPNIRRIAKMAFYGSGLSSFWIPNSIEYLEDNCLGGCEKLKKLTIPNDAKVYLLPEGRGCWLKRSSGTLYRIAWNMPGGVKFFDNHSSEVKPSKFSSILSGVSNIPELCFAETTDISEVSIPDTVMTIAEQAFYRSEVRVINLPESVAKVGKLAFGYCKKLNKVTLPKTMTWRQIENDCFLGAENVKVYINGNMSKDPDQIRRVGLRFDQVVKN